MNNLLNTTRLVVAYTKVKVANPKANVDEISQLVSFYNTADVILFPELCITGYTCGDLFNQTALLDSAWRETLRLAKQVGNQVVVVGLPFAKGHTLYNCAAILNKKSIVGLVPKTYLPNYKEFYESRWFYPAPKEKGAIINGIPFGTDLIFDNGQNLKIGIEICEDLWSTIPPSSYQALAGANLLLNLSASNETVAKSEYRRSLVENQSGRCVAAYAYCSAGPTESTTDLLFGGHCIVAENGSVLAETEKFKETDALMVDVDVEKVTNERRRTPTFQDSQQRLQDNEFRTVEVSTTTSKIVVRKENKFPFVPSNPHTLDKRCKEIFNIQVSALKKRMEQVHNKKFVIGVSGGLDSTLALLVAVKACDQLGLPRTSIDAVTMPGFGTSNHTNTNANRLMELLGVSKTTIPIGELCFNTFRQIGHNPFGIEINSWPTSTGVPGWPLDNLSLFKKKLEELPDGAKDIVFENVQARVRTMLLMSRGFVLGTGDMSELALGWCTYNGDHMSMYNVNCSIPKTLVKFLVNWVAENEYNNANVEKGANLTDLVTPVPTYTVLKSIVDTEISPELLPLKDGQIVHSTEAIVGPYSLIDFFLFHLVRNNFAPRKILALAGLEFTEYTSVQIKDWLRDFLKRFFQSQFKRSCVPDGPKVGSVSLSPRGDWRMPSDAEVDLWLKDLN